LTLLKKPVRNIPRIEETELGFTSSRVFKCRAEQRTKKGIRADRDESADAKVSMNCCGRHGKEGRHFQRERGKKAEKRRPGADHSGGRAKGGVLKREEHNQGHLHVA